MSAKTTSLAVIPSALESSVTPKPSKAEIIDALTELRVAEIRSERKSRSDRREELKPIIEKALVKLGKGKPAECDSFGWVSSSGKVSGSSLKIELGEIPNDLEKFIFEYDKIPSYFNNIDEKKIRKEVSEKVNGSLSRTDRVDAILSDEESKAALQSILTQLYK